MESREPRDKRTIGFHTLIASLNSKFKDTEKLLSAGIGILHVNLAFGTRTELDQLLHNIREESKKIAHNEIPTALALEMRGRVVRVGRLRNNCSFNLETGKTTILTADETFSLCSMPSVVFVGNFAPYIALLKLSDYIFINEKEILLQILKIIGNNVTCCIVKGGRLSSYMKVVLPYHIPFDKLTRWEKEDCIYAIKNRVSKTENSFKIHVYFQSFFRPTI
jgi:pyruvate kinase